MERKATDDGADILEKARYWADSPGFDAETRREIRELINREDTAELTERFYRELEFGTAGLRGVLGAGTARMNLYNVRKAACALARYLVDFHGADRAGQGSVGITYDSRRFSREFAEATAEVLASFGIRSLLTDRLRPVPLLSYLVRTRRCLAGVCLTASHNPPDYNGFKVYWSTGGQIIPPHDREIMARFTAIRKYEEIPRIPFAEAREKGLVEMVGEELGESYLRDLAGLSVSREGREGFRIAFTPLHGTAGEILPEALARFGFREVHVVESQRRPDGNFPTVKFPNPEDPSAMELAVALGREKGADLVLGTDPDCDRLGMLVREGDSYRYLTGNIMGSLLLEYLLSSLKEAGRLPASPLVVKTIVTTDLQNRIAEHYGAHVEETLTGFKWIGQVIEDYETGRRQPYREYVGGGEEANGFLAGRMVRDKDGINACCLAAEMTAHYKARGKSLDTVLEEIYRRHGVYHDFLHTLTLPGREGAVQIVRLMERLRENPPGELEGARLVRVRDVQAGKEWEPGRPEKAEAIGLPASNVLQFWFSDGMKISARPSGTEPKIKFYFTVVVPVADGGGGEGIRQARQAAETRAGAVRETFLRWLEAPR